MELRAVLQLKNKEDYDYVKYQLKALREWARYDFNGKELTMSWIGSSAIGIKKFAKKIWMKWCKNIVDKPILYVSNANSKPSEIMNEYFEVDYW
jgi:hypothetical protein